MRTRRLTALTAAEVVEVCGLTAAGDWQPKETKNAEIPRWLEIDVVKFMTPIPPIYSLSRPRLPRSEVVDDSE